MQGLSSDRSFGLVIATALALYAIKHPLLLVPAALVLVTALTRPQLLHGANLVWAKVGQVLHGVVNPILMTVLFFGVFTPMAVLLRVCGKDLLSLRTKSESYWVNRTSAGPLTDQF